MPSGKLYIFDTHPIQYRAPVFASLSQKLEGLKICYFNESFDGRRWWFDEVNKIPKQDFKLDLKVGYPSESWHTAGIGIWLFFWRALKTFWGRERPASVLIYGYYLPEHWILWVLCRLFRVPLIFVGESFPRQSSPIRRFIKWLLHPIFFRGVRQFIAIGNRTAQYYRSLAIAEPKITRARYCTDVNFFQQSPEIKKQQRNEIRKARGIPDEAFLMLFVGRLFERKRPWDLLEAHKILSKNYDIYTAIVGNGTLEDLLKKSWAHTPKIFWPGFQSQLETRRWYSAADVLVVPSQFETWGLVVNEAAASGLPAIVTDQCGVAGDLILSGETGFIYDVGDTAQLVLFLESLIKTPSLRIRLGQKAQQKVVSEYRCDQFADAIIEAFKMAQIA